MMQKIEFDQIRPFVRYAKVLHFSADYDAKELRAYDNRLLYFFEGSAELRIDDKVYNAERGTLLLWNADHVYSLRAHSNGFSAIVINFDYTMCAKDCSLAIPMIEAKKFDESLRTEYVSFSDASEFNDVIYSDDMRSLETDLLAIDNEFINPRHNYVMMLSSMMTTLLVKVYRRLAQQRSSVSTSMLVTGVIDYIQKNYAQDISNSSIGAQFNYHPNYINRSMLNSTGQSLHQYVISVRVLHALELIQTTDMSITEIAKAVGFKSIKHFSQSFKKIYGFSPTHFKSRG